MTFGSLFAGIGGFDLGLERAGLRCEWQVEIDPFCRRVLEKHWPNVRRWDDVRTFPPEPIEEWGVDLICGGFPCQDVSYAGHGAGLDGERSGLWTEIIRTVRVLRPRFVVVENIAALLTRGMDRVLRDLAGIGFDAEWSVLPACAMGAPHMRRRLFIVAYADSSDGQERVRRCIARSFRPLQAFDGFESSRADYATRLANPSALYRGADGVPSRLERNRAVGNAVHPLVAEWIGRRLMETAAA